jgi:hypothetical protein
MIAALRSLLDLVEDLDPPRIVPDAETAERNRESLPKCSACGSVLHFTSVGIVCMECDR